MTRFSLIAAVSLAFGCTGSIGDADNAHPGSSGTGDTTGTGTMGSCASSSARRIRRLSQREYFNVVTDLIGGDPASVAADMLPFEPTVAGFDNQDNALRVSSAFQEALANVAEKLSATVNVAMIAPCATAMGSPACLDTFVRSFARKAYGRAPSTDEVTRLSGVAAAGDSYATSVQLVVEYVLQSPSLLYATELGPDAAPSAPSVALTQTELASQISLLLTGARPDETLLHAAEGNQLSTHDQLVGVVQRLLATPRARDQVRLFTKGWIDLGPIADAPKNVDAFPTYTAAVTAAMQDEVDAFIDAKVNAGQGTFASLLSDTSTHIPTDLGMIYGAELNGQTLDPKHRRGILSLPGVLTYHSADQHSGPVLRGLLVRRQLLCQDVPPPPASVLQQIAQHPIDPTDKATTTRQKYEQHKTDPFCASCHDQFDPIGFGMEEMDGIGRYRTTENGLPIDTSGTLNNTDVNGNFAGVVDLEQKLEPSGELASCYVRQFFRFAESRVPDATEQCIVEGWTTAFTAGGGHLGDLLVGYVTSAGFATRKEDR